MRNKRHVVIVEDPSALMPIDWMLAVLRDPEAEQNRRDQMAALAAPYVHARLSAAMVSSHSNSNTRDNGDTNGLQILAVPRGCRVERDGTALTVDGEAIELRPLEPFTGTPPLLADQRDYNDQCAEPERERFEVPETEVPQNLVRLDVYKSKHDDSDGEPPGAA